MHIAHENHQKLRLMVEFVYLTTSVLRIREISSCLIGDIEKGKYQGGNWYINVFTHRMTRVNQDYNVCYIIII